MRIWRIGNLSPQSSLDLDGATSVSGCDPQKAPTLERLLIRVEVINLAIQVLRRNIGLLKVSMGCDNRRAESSSLAFAKVIGTHAKRCKDGMTCIRLPTLDWPREIEPSSIEMLSTSYPRLVLVRGVLNLKWNTPSHENDRWK